MSPGRDLVIPAPHLGRSQSLRSLPVLAAIALLDPPCCTYCGSVLVLTQPDEADPDHLVGVCSAGGGCPWHLVELPSD